MKVLRSGQIKALDKFTIENEPILSINLMERAAGKCTEWITSHFGVGKEFKIFVGPGDNGGDGLAIARMLSERGYYVEAYITGKLSEKGLINYNRLVKKGIAKVFTVNGEDKFPMLEKTDIIIDALFGAGLNRPFEGYIGTLVNYLNDSGATILSIDIPSGLFAEDNSPHKTIEVDGVQYYQNVIRANYTLTLELPFISFFFADDAVHVGQWFILPIGLHRGFLRHEPVDNYYVTQADVQAVLKQRPKFSHKGHYGHALLIAGSAGKMGAAQLAAKACMRAGAGLTTTHTPISGAGYLQTTVPENMISFDEHDEYFTTVPHLDKYDAIGVGPGIGTYDITATALKQLLEAADTPMVLDADALNILAEHKHMLDLVPENSILTPHPKELDRLTAPKNSVYSRVGEQARLAKKYNIYVIQKGANTATATPEGVIFFNSTGTPGMSTGGTGDVLTGVILGLLAQGYQPKDAAILGAFLHGLAGEKAAGEHGMEAMIAGDLIEHMGSAFKTLYKKSI